MLERDLPWPLGRGFWRLVRILFTVIACLLVERSLAIRARHADPTHLELVGRGALSPGRPLLYRAVVTDALNARPIPGAQAQAWLVRPWYDLPPPVLEPGPTPETAAATGPTATTGPTAATSPNTAAPTPDDAAVLDDLDPDLSSPDLETRRRAERRAQLRRSGIPGLPGTRDLIEASRRARQDTRRTVVLPLGAFTTGPDGVASIEAALPATLDPGTWQLLVRAQSPSGTDTALQEVSIRSRLELRLTTDKPQYQPGQRIHVRTLALEALDGRPATDRSIRLELFDPNGTRLFEQTLSTSSWGIASTDLPLADTLNPGDYALVASLDELRFERRIQVKSYALPRFELELETDRQVYRPSESIRVDLRADYVFGRPVAWASGQARVTVEGHAAELTRSGSTDEGGHLRLVLPLAELGLEPRVADGAILHIDAELIEPGGQRQYRSIERTLTRGSTTGADAGGLAVDAEVVSLQTDRGSYRPGETVTLAITVGRARHLLLDLVHQGQTVGHLQSAVPAGASFLRWPLPAGAKGSLELIAYERRPGDDTGAGDEPTTALERLATARLEVTLPRSLNVSITADRPAYEPGDEAKLRLEVRDAAGRPVTAALGVAGIDAALFALTDAGSGSGGAAVDAASDEALIAARGEPFKVRQRPFDHALEAWYGTVALALLGGFLALTTLAVAGYAGARQLRGRAAVDVDPEDLIALRDAWSAVVTRLALGVAVWGALLLILFTPHWRYDAFWMVAALAVLLAATDGRWGPRWLLLPVPLIKLGAYRDSMFSDWDPWRFLDAKLRPDAMDDSPSLLIALLVIATVVLAWRRREGLLPAALIAGFVLASLVNLTGGSVTSLPFVVVAMVVFVALDLRLTLGRGRVEGIRPYAGFVARAVVVANLPWLAVPCQAFVRALTGMPGAGPSRLESGAMAHLAYKPDGWVLLGLAMIGLVATVGPSIRRYRALPVARLTPVLSRLLPGLVPAALAGMLLMLLHLLHVESPLPMALALQARDGAVAWRWGSYDVLELTVLLLAVLFSALIVLRETVLRPRAARYAGRSWIGRDAVDALEPDAPPPGPGSPRSSGAAGRFPSAASRPRLRARAEAAVLVLLLILMAVTYRIAPSGFAGVAATAAASGEDAAGTASWSREGAAGTSWSGEGAAGAVPATKAAADAPRIVRAALSGARVRQDFPETLLWRPEVITDAEGRAELAVPLADAITTWRIGAEALALSGATGAAERDLAVTKALFVDPTLPATLTRGDALEVPIAVYNGLDRALEARVEVRDDAWFSLEAAGPDRVALGPKGAGRTWVRIRVRKAGLHALTVSVREAQATGGGAVIADRAGEASPRIDVVRRLTRVEPEGRLRAVALNGLAGKDATALTLDLPIRREEDLLELSFKLYPGMSGVAREGLEGLLAMPHGCFEQTSSVLYPDLLVYDYLKGQGRLSPAFETLALETLALGYQRLLAYEVPGGGFSGFGHAPADPVLTAYGLMELEDLARVWPVSPELLARTRRWLTDRLAADGRWRADGADDGSGGATGGDRSILATTAWISWAQARGGRGSASASGWLAAACEKATAGTDAYVLALCANALEANIREDDAARIIERLVALRQRARGQVWWTSAGEGVMHSAGEALTVETTALALQALIAAGRDRLERAPVGDWTDEPDGSGAGGGLGASEADGSRAVGSAAIEPDLAWRALRWLISKRRPSGDWGSTQATVQSLRALLAWERAAPTRATRVSVEVNGRSAGGLEAGRSVDAIGRLDLATQARRGENTIRVARSGPGRLPWQLAARYYLPWPEAGAHPSGAETSGASDGSLPSDPGGSIASAAHGSRPSLPSEAGAPPLELSLRYDRLELRPDERLSCEVELRNRRGRAIAMPIVQLGLPPGLELDRTAFERLVVERSIERYELSDRRVTLYLSALGDRPLRFSYQLRALRPLRVLTAGSSAWAFYEPGTRYEVAPVRIEVSGG